MKCQCPKCENEMIRGNTYYRSGDNPDLFMMRCVECDMCICWFEMKDDVSYTITGEKSENVE